jgi:hypothetical protein
MNYLKLILLLFFCQALSPLIYGRNCGDFFDFKFDRCVYDTPCEAILSIEMTNHFVMNKPYVFKVSVFMYNSLLKEYRLSSNHAMSTQTTLAFPQITQKTHVRCRVEMLLEDVFIEAREKILTLYPPSLFIDLIDLRNTFIWVYDESGQAQKLLSQLAISYTDASYQLVRDFSTPDIVIIGPDSNPNKTQVLFDRLKTCNQPHVIFIMKQTEYPVLSRIKTVDCPSQFEHITIDPQSDFFNDLDTCDLLTMLEQRASCLCIPDKAFAGSLKSLLTCRTDYPGNMNSILGFITDSNRTVIYCQLSIKDTNPAAILLFKNILAYSAGTVKNTSAY